MGGITLILPICKFGIPWDLFFVAIARVYVRFYFKLIVIHGSLILIIIGSYTHSCIPTTEN